MRRGGWVGSIHDAIGPRLARLLGELVLSDIVKFHSEKPRSDPLQKVRSVFGKDKPFIC